jgi:glucose 1-dehydrogenase
LAVVVTGALGGLGSSVVDAFLHDGMAVAALDVGDPESRQVDLGHGDNLKRMWVDVTSVESVRRAADEVWSWRPATVLVNCAAITSRVDFLELEEREWCRVVDVNLTGTFITSQEFGRRMAAAGGGVIVNVSSTSAVIARGHLAHYAASKGGVRQLTKSMAIGLAGDGVRVIAVAPGPLERAIVGGGGVGGAQRVDRIAVGRLGLYSEVAAAIKFLASDECAFATGTSFYIDGGMTSAL